MNMEALMNTTTFVGYLYHFNETFIKRSRTYNTYVKYRSVIAHQIEPFFGHIEIKNLSKSLILNYYNYIRLKYSSHTVNTSSIILQAGLELLKQEGLIEENYAKYIKREKSEPKRLPTLTNVELNLLLSSFKKDKLYGNFFMFLYWTGMRRGEALAITISDIDFDAKTIRICKQVSQRTKNGGAEILHHTKTKKDRFISLNKDVIELVESQLKNNERYKRNHASYNDSGLLFQSKRGNCLFNPELMEHFKTIAASIGYPELTLHDLRKLRAVYLTESSSLETARTELGHSKGTTTIKFYSRITKSQMIKLANHIDEVFGGYICD